MTTSIITAVLVSEAQRMDTADKFFGIRYPVTVEPMVYHFATQLAPAYNGGYWNFYQLSNGGFFMAPKLDESFKVIADNGFNGSMSAEALGVTACLYAYSNLSFGEGRFGETCADHYHWLRAFAMEHAEAGGVLAAID